MSTLVLLSVGLRVDGTMRAMRRPPSDDARPGTAGVPAAPGVVPP